MTHIDELAGIGTATWLDDLSRDRIDSGNLEELLTTKSIVGVTTNPAIFAAAMTSGTAYDEQIEVLRSEGADADTAVYAMAVDDVRRACDIFRDTFERTGGVDGRVSIEVDPRISDDAEATLVQARELWKRVDRPNLLIKIPATLGSLPAITRALSEGISVNVTLIFSCDRYSRVIDAYKEGIRAAAEKGLDVAGIQSVASFFVSRLDVEVDRRLEEIGTEAALALRGKAGVANTRLAYDLFRTSFADNGELPEGATVQRPLWASTGVKNPDYPATLYVTEIAGPQTVNTMPEPTIDAVLAEGGLHGDTLTDRAGEAREVLAAVEAVGVDLDDVFAVLEREGVEKFEKSWNELLDSMRQRL
ncbi:transaldolase [Corynebacterium pygosceleis]|uniref:Transaldolase n=1 Tax=Corynebacterium pygosceleis TaxID=2800406 RepID=A0A9Q4GKV4_9CORY|nr:transaldolase [Corynebacterium pygosceleis]MCK7636997.1 transaldolase [Corynebacterium pygosceleis]MCK7674471.1 transaldolase [Corynebacterium pygosceleis]MCL0120231.1 transaldolase [Corynebacterium pygosceleis]MCX7443778.1 transaldolase [Corynebacterium pygosceleis]MCX7467750.1 transaldolase [Corynebacterium pygosceleis]